jgi:GT2 family glycosyltransferase
VIEENSKPTVGIVIVNHNLKDSLRQTLDCFARINYPNLNVVVSDNASTDGSQEMVRKEFPDVHLLSHSQEQGYARAARLGMAFLVNKTKYIFSTTNDVTVDPEIINVLVDYAEKDPHAGVLGTKIYFHERPNVLWHAGGRIHPLHGHSYHLGWEHKDAPRYSRVRECDFVTGCGFLMRCEALLKVGFFKEDLVFYSEDAELCYRIREGGYRIVFIPEAKMWHKTGTTLAKNRPVQLRYSTRNSLYLIQRHKVGYYPLSLLVYLFAVSPLKMLLFVVMLRWKNALGIYHGIRDWRAGQYGRVTNC